MEALLIIDMQVGCLTDNQRYDTPGTIERINKVSGYFRKNNKPVIFIQHDGTKESYLFPGTEEWKVHPELIQNASDYYVKKTLNSAFYKTNLESLLKELQVDELYIAGCATDFCVNATIHSAITKDFNLTILKDCHTTADRPGFSAKDLIKFHNWLWESLTPGNGSIRLKSSTEV